MISDVRKLRALREVASRGTVTAAADALGYTPSAISQQLASLEADLGVAVLERRGRNVALTEAGALLVEHSTEVLGALERAETAVAELHGKPVGPVRIGSLASAAGAILPGALTSLYAKHPCIEPHVFLHPFDQNLKELRLGTLDVAIDQCYEQSPHNLFDELHQTLLLREPLYLVSSAEHPIARLEDAADRPWLAAPADSSCGQIVRKVAGRAGIAPRFTYETDDHFASVQLIQAGLTVGILPSLALVSNPTGVHLSLIPDEFRCVYALTRPASRTRPAVAALIAELVQAADDYATKGPCCLPFGAERTIAV